jgi:RimJ/RimL family protein N-acetyltransferase
MTNQHLYPTRSRTTELLTPPPPTWRDRLPTLVGERVTLRELYPDDARQLTALLSAPEVARFTFAPPATVEQFGCFINWSRREREAGRYAAFALVPHGASSATGLLQVRQLDPAFHAAEWGFALGTAWWGAGLFTESAHLLLDFIFTTLGVHRLEARAAVPNVRAHAAISRLGGVREGVLRRSLVTRDGQQLDQVLWSLLADEWRARAKRPETQVH